MSEGQSVVAQQHVTRALVRRPHRPPSGTVDRRRSDTAASRALRGRCEAGSVELNLTYTAFVAHSLVVAASWVSRPVVVYLWAGRAE